MDYTKGEWKIIPLSGHSSISYFIDNRQNDITVRIAEVYKAPLLTQEQTKANAHLIAAAPKLFEWIKAKADNGDNDAQCFLATLDI